MTAEIFWHRAIDEHQKILNSHFDLKALYTKELEQLSQLSLIKRFSFRTEFYDKVLEDASALERMDYFLRPLFCQDIDKIYNLNKAFQLQKPVRKREEQDSEEVLDFDEDAWQKEQEELRKIKMKKYEDSLDCIFRYASENGEISLKQLQEKTKDHEDRDRLIPCVEIFKEIMVELIRNREIDIEVLQKERSAFIQEKSGEFQLNDMVLQLVDEHKEYADIVRIEAYRIPGDGAVVFEQVSDEEGRTKSIRCSNVLVRILRRE